jgi:deazaflavin-dependent oxidoreductase (nitroreductase family)
VTVPSLLLTTTGRKSGEKFIFPLFYGNVGDSYIIVASKGRAPQHPGWYRNILANPDVDVQVGTAKLKARARTAAGEERARLWQKPPEFWPPYAESSKRPSARSRWSCWTPSIRSANRRRRHARVGGPGEERKRCSSRKPAAASAASCATRLARRRSWSTPATAPIASA